MVLLACMKFLGKCLCPCCLVEKENVFRLGSKKDSQIRNRKQAIFDFGRGVISAAVEKILGALSLVPTRNAFSEKLS